MTLVTSDPDFKGTTFFRHWISQKRHEIEPWLL